MANPKSNSKLLSVNTPARHIHHYSDDTDGTLESCHTQTYTYDTNATFQNSVMRRFQDSDSRAMPLKHDHELEHSQRISLVLSSGLSNGSGRRDNSHPRAINGDDDDDPFWLHVLACLSFFIFPPLAFVGCCVYGKRSELGPRQSSAWIIMVICAIAGCLVITAWSIVLVDRV